MRPLSFRVKTLLVCVTACAFLLAFARYWGPMDGGSLAVAGGAEPHPVFLNSLARQLEAEGYTRSSRPSCILCVDGDWKWYQHQKDPTLTIGIDFDDQDCLVEIRYENPWWLPFDFGTTEANALQLAREIEVHLHELLASEESTNQEIHRSSRGQPSFLIGSFAGTR